ncbi:hypothetical protein ACFX2I_017183 [Malus domestica]
MIMSTFRADMKVTVGSLQLIKTSDSQGSSLNLDHFLSQFKPFLGQLAVFARLQFTPASFSNFIIVVHPALTFIVSWYRGSQTVHIHNRRSHAKLLRLLMVISRAIDVSLIDGPKISIAHASTSSGHPYNLFNNWVKGPLLVGISVVIFVCYNLLMVACLLFVCFC